MAHLNLTCVQLQILLYALRNMSGSREIDELAEYIETMLQNISEDPAQDISI